MAVWQHADIGAVEKILQVFVWDVIGKKFDIGPTIGMSPDAMLVTSIVCLTGNDQHCTAIIEFDECLDEIVETFVRTHLSDEEIDESLRRDAEPVACISPVDTVGIDTDVIAMGDDEDIFATVVGLGNSLSAGMVVYMDGISVSE